MATKFNKFNVTNGTDKARVHYSLDNRCDGRKCVTIYAKDFPSGDALRAMMADSYINRTDSNQDYFDRGNVTLFEGDAGYTAARTRAEQNKGEDAAKSEAKRAARMSA